MPDAVIVSAARTAIGTARKGTLLDVSAFDLAKYAVGEALKRSGIPAGDVDDMQMGESLQGGGDIARYAAIELGLIEVPGRRAQPPLRVGHGVRCRARPRSIMAGMDKVVIAGGAESRCRPSPMVMKRTLGTDDWAQWMSPSHPETARRARVRHVDHRRLQHRARRPASPARTATRGRSVRTSARSQAIDEGRLEEEIVADRGRRCATARRRSSTPTSTRAATARWRRWRR